VATKAIARAVPVFSLLVLSILSILSLLSACGSCDGGANGDTSGPGAVAEDAVTPLTEPWMRVIPFQETPEGLETIRAAECGECHTEIYAEWQTATHAVALQDRQFQAEWNKDDKLWLCANCHTPLANQFEDVVVGLIDGDYRRPVTEHNDRFDPVLQQESITCATCHVRDGAILGPGFGGESPHPVRVDPTVLSQQVCVACHNVHARLSGTLVCNFSTGDEWAMGPAPREGLGCIDCHMPTVERPIAEGGPVRTSHVHRWPGSGIAKFPEDVETVRGFYVPGYEIEVAAHRTETGGGEAAVAIELTVTNHRAGHVLPTGDVERFITMSLSIQSEDGVSLWDHEERFGERWEWHPEARQLSDNSLEPRVPRELRFEAPLPADQGGTGAPLFVEVIGQNHRMTEENAEGDGILGQYPIAVETMRTRVEVMDQEAPVSP